MPIHIPKGSQGLTLLGIWGVAQLVYPTKITYNFLLKEGLYRLTRRVTQYEGVSFGQREDLMTEEEIANDEHHIKVLG